MSTYRLKVRRFLNRLTQHAGAYVRAVVRDTSRTKGSYVFDDIQLDIADCARVVSLEFPLETEARRRNSVAKARALADVLTRFAVAPEAEAQVAARRERLEERYERFRAVG